MITFEYFDYIYLGTFNDEGTIVNKYDTSCPCVKEKI